MDREEAKNRREKLNNPNVLFKNDEEIKNNKEELPWEHYQELYAKLDPAEAADRCQVEYDAEKGGFAIRLMGVDYRISHPEFIVETDHEGYAAVRDSIPAKILVARFLLEGKFAPATGNFVTYRDVPWGELYFRPFQGRCLMRLAFGYGFKLPVLKAIFEKLGATPVKTGDVGYRYEFINNVEMQVLLWGGDDEFPPSSQILFAENVTSAFGAEDMAVMGDVSINTFKAMEKELKQ